MSSSTRDRSGGDQVSFQITLACLGLEVCIGNGKSDRFLSVRNSPASFFMMGMIPAEIKPRTSSSSFFFFLLLLLRAVPERCVDLVEDCKKATSVHFYVAIKSSQNKENRIATITCTHHVQLPSLQ